MKIIMFGWEFPPHNSGGLGMACLGLSRALKKQGVELIMVLPRKLEGYDASLKIIFPDDYCHVNEQIFINSLIYPYITKEEYAIIQESDDAQHFLYGHNLFEEVMRYGLVARIIAKQERFDIIHAHDWLAVKAGIAAKNISGKKLVFHVHATEFDRTGGNGVNEKVFKIEKEGMEKADKIIAVSNFTKNIIMKHYNASPEKIEVIHNSVSEDDFPFLSNLYRDILPIKKAGYKLVIFVGRITLQKGVEYFLRAAKIASEHLCKTVFIVVGSGDMEKQMIKEASDLGISDKVIFTGFLRGEKLSKIYHSADLLVMPSISEPFGLTALESIHHGTPVLISKQSGVSEMLSHALKVDFWDTRDMANKIIAALKYNSLNSCLKNCAQKEIKTYNWDEAAKKCVSVYNSCV